MANTRARLLKVVPSPECWAVYAEDFVFGDEDAHFGQILEQAGIVPAPAPRHRPPKYPDRPERWLDLVEEEEGVLTYIFYLDAKVEGRHRLKFVELDPFSELPNHSATGERFLSNFTVYPNSDRRLASFRCDVGAARGSALASRIQNLIEEAGARHHQPFLNIPFRFNVIDPELGAAPWVVPSELDEPGKEGEAKSASGAARPGDILTHGGVHPSSASFLSLPL